MNENEDERHEDSSQQASESGDGTNTVTALRFLLIGMGIGAGVALLFAPMSGHEARDAIRQGCRNALDGISDQTRNLRDRGSNLLGFNRRKLASGDYERGAGI
jgi:hypothetical protein